MLFESIQCLFLYNKTVLTLSDRPIRGTLLEVFKKKFSKSLSWCDRRPRRGTFFVTFKKNPGVSEFMVLLLLHRAESIMANSRHSEMYFNEIEKIMMSNYDFELASFLLPFLEFKHQLDTDYMISDCIYIRKSSRITLSLGFVYGCICTYFFQVIYSNSFAKFYSE